jgi:hypothetical protein
MKQSKKNPKRRILFSIVKNHQNAVNQTIHNTTQQITTHTSYQLPTATRFGTKVPSSDSLSTTKFRRSNALTATTKAASLTQFKPRTTDQQHKRTLQLQQQRHTAIGRHC